MTVRNTLEYLFLIPLFFTVMPSDSAQAQDALIDELMAMDISELTVFAASKREENIAEAPGVVSIVTADDIRRYGAKNLTDILKRMPNVYTFGSAGFPQNIASIRGGTLTNIDNHILILLNGRPMRESYAGGTNMTIYQSFPVDIINHIEMIRGPGSVLYGTNAFSGVLNIVTKSAEKLQDNSVSVGYGSFDTKNASIVGGKRYAAHDLSVVGAANFRDTQGWDFDYTGTSGIHGHGKMEQDSHGAFAQVKYGNITLTGSDAYTNIPRFNTVNSPAFQHFKHRKRFWDLEYSTPLFDSSWETTTNLTYNGFHEVGIFAPIDSRDYLIETSLTGEMTDNIRILTGAIMDNVDIRLNRATTDATTLWSGYGQLDWRVQDWLKLTGGLQLNKPKGLKRSYSPRISAIVTPVEHWGAKLLYGEAFRSSSGVERAIYSPGFLEGNPNLKPESIKTFDAQIFYHNRECNAALTFYKSIQEDTIIRQGTFPVTYANGGDVVYKGVEFEVAAKLSHDWELDGSLSWQTGEDNTGNDDAGFVPHTMAKLGIVYNPGQGYSLGLYDIYTSEAAELEQFVSGVSVVNRKPEPTHFITANLDIDVNAVTGLQSLPKTEFSLFAENLLDEDIDFPEIDRKALNTIPQTSGRALYARFKVKF